MSQRYKGAVISATPPTTTGGETGTAKGVWTLQQQFQAQGSSNWPVPYIPAYIEDVFSTYLYAGEGGTKTITNNIDLANKGGMVWIKGRDYTNTNHGVWDTMRGAGTSSSASKAISTNLSNAQSYATQDYISSFNANGFSVTYGGGTSLNYLANRMGANYVSWTFAKQPKFFDVVTWTGNGVSGRTINHNLASTPGCIIIKQTSGVEAWDVYHRSLWTSTAGPYVRLNETGPSFPAGERILAVSTTTFTIGNNDAINSNGATYVAYIFAHNAGGFGLTGTDNVISCGSFTTDSPGSAVVNLGYELQWGLFKNVSADQSWFTSDTMRGMPVGGGDQYLLPNTANQEASYAYINPTATGFTISNQYGSNTYIYIAIRRGPMKTPTTGTSVFSPNAVATDTSLITTNFAVDLTLEADRSGSTYNFLCGSRLVNDQKGLITSKTDPEANFFASDMFQSNVGVTPGAFLSASIINYSFVRAPGFCDVVCYLGSGASSRNISHNLTVPPELIITRCRDNTTNRWPVWYKDWGNTDYFNYLELTQAPTNRGFNYITATSSTTYTVGSDNAYINGSNLNYVAFLFGSVPGVSKVSSYTGNGNLNTITTDFSPRFIMIKRSDSTGRWWVYDTARGITTGNDPYMALNSVDAEVTNTNYINVTSTGFVIDNAPAEMNANGGTYIYLAIA